jgi:hypothetical protein
LAVLTYSFVRSARPSGCALLDAPFLNTPIEEIVDVLD